VRHDPIDDLLRQFLASGDLTDEGSSHWTIQPTQQLHTDMRPGGPRRLHFRTSRDD
jgi:hypothetical protein